MFSIFVVVVMMMTVVVSGKGLRSAFKSGEKSSQESVKFEQESVVNLIEKSSKTHQQQQRQKVSVEDALEGLDFGYKQANDHSKKSEPSRSSPGSGLGVEERQPHRMAAQRQQQFVQQAPRFARQRTMFPRPAFPGMPGAGGPYSFGSQYGRGMGDMNQPMYGHFGGMYGPMGGGPLSPNSGMGSFPASVDPRGFGMMGNTSQPWDIGMQHPFMPSFGKQMVEGMPFPTQLQGYGIMNHGMGLPPFTGQKFSAMGPYGPFDLSEDDDDDGPGTKTKENTTLMGPRPFGPYGVQPQMPQMGGQGGGMPWGPYGGPMMGGGGMGMMGGGGMGMMGGGNPMMTMGGLGPRYDPRVVMHHMAMMGGGEQTFNTPGLIHGSGSGYPHPDFDRYHSVLYAPVPPEGGEAAKAAA